MFKIGNSPPLSFLIVKGGICSTYRWVLSWLLWKEIGGLYLTRTFFSQMWYYPLIKNTLLTFLFPPTWDKRSLSPLYFCHFKSEVFLFKSNLHLHSSSSSSKYFELGDMLSTHLWLQRLKFKLSNHVGFWKHEHTSDSHHWATDRWKSSSTQRWVWFFTSWFISHKDFCLKNSDLQSWFLLFSSFTKWKLSWRSDLWFKTDPAFWGGSAIDSHRGECCSGPAGVSVQKRCNTFSLESNEHLDLLRLIPF